MKIETHSRNGQTVAEVIGDGILIETPADGLQILMDAGYAGQGKVILHQRNITPEFFDLKTRLAGEILQKASNYQVQVAIVGDFENVESQALRAFIVESNRGRQNFFVKDLEAALTALAGT